VVAETLWKCLDIYQIGALQAGLQAAGRLKLGRACSVITFFKRVVSCLRSACFASWPINQGGFQRGMAFLL
jgi:hypothetical protein